MEEEQNRDDQNGPGGRREGSEEDRDSGEGGSEEMSSDPEGQDGGEGEGAQDGGEGEGEEEEEEEADDSQFEDPEGYVDNIADEELLGDVLKEKPVLKASMDAVIVVDNAPKVGPDRMEKLKTVLRKIFKRFGTVEMEYYPLDENGIFKGYFFLEYSAHKEAVEAVTTTNGYRLDKSHIFAVNFFSDFEKYAQIPEKWEPPKKAEFKEIGNLRSWLLDADCNDQFVFIYGGGSDVGVCHNTPQEPVMVDCRKGWTETYVMWSPRGTYLATLHNRGIALWGTGGFKQLHRFSHSGVQLIDFSPCERYLVSFSPTVVDPNNPQNIVVWDVRTGERKKTFMRGNAEDWPILKWSHDGIYFARMSDNLLGVYEIPSFTLLDKKSLIIRGIKDFCWSPQNHFISYWVPEATEIPAKITIISIPSRQEITTKSRHLVSDCKMQWHKQGDYLCVRVDHWMTKSKKQSASSFEIFHLREALVPVDTIEIKEPVLAFSLEPKGTKFAIIHGEPPTRISASFYNISGKGGKIEKTKTLERQNASHIFWSPQGQFVVLAGLKSNEGTVEFYDTTDMTLMSKMEHNKATDLEWDPTGRYIVTSVSFWKHKVDTGFVVWSFQGRLLYRNPNKFEKICQFLWRPRPPTLLTEADLKRIKKDYKQYSLTFEKKDRALKSKTSKELIEKRRRLVKEFKDYQEKKKRAMAKWRTNNVSQSNSEFNEDEEVEYVEHSFDILISETVENV